MLSTLLTEIQSCLRLKVLRSRPSSFLAKTSQGRIQAYFMRPGSEKSVPNPENRLIFRKIRLASLAERVRRTHWPEASASLAAQTRPWDA